MPKVAAVMTRVSGAVAAATSPRPSTPSACARIGALTRTANGGKKLPIRVCSMWPATSPGPFFGVAAFAVVAGADAAGADVAGADVADADVADADVAELASTGVFAESAMAAVVAAVAAVVHHFVGARFSGAGFHIGDIANGGDNGDGGNGGDDGGHCRFRENPGRRQLCHVRVCHVP